MRQPAHTPGPWRVVDHNHIKDSAGNWIASADVHGISYAKPTDAERAANARLIAAAPTMVDLLQRAADSLQDYCTEANGDLNDSLAAEIEKLLDSLQPQPTSGERAPCPNS
jgi:hypothetical protein